MAHRLGILIQNCLRTITEATNSHKTPYNTWEINSIEVTGGSDQVWSAAEVLPEEPLAGVIISENGDEVDLRNIIQVFIFKGKK